MLPLINGCSKNDQKNGSTQNTEPVYTENLGKFVITPQYEEVRSFSEGLPVVRFGRQNQSRWGYINPRGKIIISDKKRFYGLGNFNDGLAYVIKNGKIGFID